MPDSFFWGKKGSGKTLHAVEEATLDYYCGYGIWSNLWLHPAYDTNYKTRKKGNYHYIDAVDLIRLMLDDSIPETNEPQLLILDEMKSQGSARDFMSFINKNLTNFVSQARKRNFKIIYTDQILSAYDKWIRMMTDHITRCRAIINPNDIGWGTTLYPEPLYFEYISATIDEDEPEGIRDVRVYYRSRQTARMFYPCYRTKQMITPVSLKYSDAGEKREVKEHSTQ